jgi:hypothetical protein
MDSQTRQAHLVIGIERIRNPTGRQSQIFESSYGSSAYVSSDFSIRSERSLAFVLHYHNTPCSRSSTFTPSVQEFYLPSGKSRDAHRKCYEIVASIAPLCSCQSHQYNILQASNDTITGCRLNKVFWLAVDADADDFKLRLCGLPLPVGMKDMVCHRLLGLVWRAKNISIHHDVASSHAIVRFSISFSFFKPFTALIYPIRAYILYLSCGERIEPDYYLLVWFDIYTIFTRLERDGGIEFTKVQNIC